MAIFTHALQQIVHILHPQGPQPQPPPDLEAGVQDHITDWANLMITFVLAVAPAIPLTYAQIHSKFSPTFNLVSFEFLLSLATFFVSKFMKPKFPVLARGLNVVGIFFAVTAFFTAIMIPFPLYLQIITWVVYAISCLAISVPIFFQVES
jgi:hypothetical protein